MEEEKGRTGGGHHLHMRQGTDQVFPFTPFYEHGVAFLPLYGSLFSWTSEASQEAGPALPGSEPKAQALFVIFTKDRVFAP